MSMSMPTSTSMSMDMGTMSSMAPMASSSGGMSGMDDMEGMGMGNGCKISMLWNWNVIDTCFISESWHVTSRGMFAGSCIGVILLVILLEFLRRAAKEYDGYIVMQHSKTLVSNTAPSSASSSDGNGTNKNPATTALATSSMAGGAVAYFVMLLAMYYNGYFIVCIFIGAYIGYFIFGWESFNVKKGGEDRMQENATVCCG
ncbi:ctr copper transporter [Stemphylium lycopersici]|nr:ctr copper transporter [Stemphylium lycopersici]